MSTKPTLKNPDFAEIITDEINDVDNIAYPLNTVRDLVYTSIVQKSDVIKAEDEIRSKQESELKNVGLEYNDFVAPPYPQLELLEIIEFNTTHFKCVNIKVLDSTQRGYKLTETDLSASQSDKDRIIEFLSKTNSRGQNHLQIAAQYVFDRIVFGSGALELPRETDGIYEMNHIPVYRIKPHKDAFTPDSAKPIFKYELSNGDFAFFKKFGDTRSINRKTGKIEEGLDLKDQAREIIYQCDYYPSKSPYYGLSMLIPCFTITSGYNKQLLFNVSYFSSMGTVKNIVSFEGNVKKGHQSKIKKFLQANVQDVKQKTLVVGLRPGSKIDVKDLQDKPVEASFSEFGKITKEGIYEAHGVPMSRLGKTQTGALGGNVLQEEARIYNDTVLFPPRTAWEDVINLFITHEQGLNIKGWKYELNQLDVKDAEFEFRKANEGHDRGILNNREWSELVGVGHFEKDDPLGDQRILKAGFVPLSMVTGDAVAKSLTGDIMDVLKEVVEKLERR